MRNETFEVVRFYDPEVVKHTDASQAGEYASTRDMAVLDLPPEAKPIVFTCRLLSRQARRTYTEQTTPERKYEVAFRLGVVGIRDLPSEDGVLRSWTRTGKPWDAITDDALDHLGLSDADLWEIGSVIAARSFLALGTPLACQQLDSSLRAWVATSTTFRLAEQKKAEETHADEPSS